MDWGVVFSVIGTVVSHPEGRELIKQMGFFIAAWLLLKKGFEKNLSIHFGKLNDSITELTAAFKNLETKHDLRITNLEHDVQSLKETHADQPQGR